MLEPENHFSDTIWFVNKCQKTQPTFWGSVENRVSTSWSEKYNRFTEGIETNPQDGPLGT